MTSLTSPLFCVQSPRYPNLITYQIAAMASLAAMDNFRLEDVVVSSRGSKSAQLKNGKSPVIFMPTEYLQMPAGPFSFQDQETTRMTLEFRCDEEAEDF